METWGQHPYRTPTLMPTGGGPYEIDLKRYRIGIINDFRDSFTYCDHQDYGSLQSLDVCRVSGVHRGYQESKDTIGVFLNFKLLNEFKEKNGALKLVRELVEKAPPNAKTDFERHLDVLIQDLI